jgi:hypothetical protein
MNTNSNPYAPPASDLATGSHPNDSAALAFFPVSVFKLFVMSFCTLGLYEYYWFYKNWKAYRSHTIENIYPFWRAVFPVFFCYQLFDRVRKHNPSSPAASLAAGPLATVWIVTALLWRLPDPYWLVIFLGVFAMLPVQSAINTINQLAAPHHDANARFTGWNWVAIVLGTPLLMFALYGTIFMPE